MNGNQWNKWKFNKKKVHTQVVNVIGAQMGK